MTESGEIVLSRVVIPEYIIVHDGAPEDSTARDYYVRYRDYIKNVASSEIYATWPDATLRANILAIMSFTLNRVYTEWYRNKGYKRTSYHLRLPMTTNLYMAEIFIPIYRAWWMRCLKIICPDRCQTALKVRHSTATESV